MNILFAMSALVLIGGQVVMGLLAIVLAIYLGAFSAKNFLAIQSNEIKGEQQSDNLSPFLAEACSSHFITDVLEVDTRDLDFLIKKESLLLGEAKEGVDKDSSSES